MTTLAFDTQSTDNRADWLLVFDAAMRVGNFSSLDALFLRALDAWLSQLTPALRWDIAIELYTTEHVSTGRAAEIAGLNYFVFMEELRTHGIPFMGAEPAAGEEKERKEALLDELFNFSSLVPTT
ncbi:MAG: UPF0175 family protein [Chloroflexota bacterium]